MANPAAAGGGGEKLADISSGGGGGILTYPFTASIKWVMKVSDAVSWQLVAFIFSCHFCLKGVTLGLVGQAGLPFSQQYLKLSAEETQRYGIVAMFPWSIKPLVGMISDVLPIAGYHKRYYMFFVSILGACALAYLGAVEIGPGHALVYVAALVLINLQVSVVDLLTEGKYTEKMRGVPEVSSDIVSLVWTNMTCGGLLATAISFFALQTKNYRAMFWCAVPFSVQAIFTSFAGLLPEEKSETNAVNTELLVRHKSMFAMGTFMGVVCVLLAVVQLTTTDMYVELVVTLGCAIVLSLSMFWCMPSKLAKATLFLFLTNTVSVSFGSAMQYWFTVDDSCNPGGPHFDYLFFTVYTAIIAQVFSGVGIWVFNSYFSKIRMRKALWISAIISSTASIGDLAMVMRWNLRWGIPDKWFYLVGDTILEPIVLMMAFMPSTVLISKMCPKNMEATTFAILASFSNLGGALSSSFGVFAMQMAGIQTELEIGECNFDNLPHLIVICGMILPLIAIPLTFVLIPDIDMHETVDMDECEEDDGGGGGGGGKGEEKTPLVSAGAGGGGDMGATKTD
jgi:folate/biopterin transporter